MDKDKISQNQRKRTLEALERRFAVAKAEALQQHKKNIRKPDEEDKKENLTVTSTSGHLAAVTASPLSASIKKGGSLAATLDGEETGLAYAQLSQPVHENLLTTNVELWSKRGSMADKILHELLQHGDSAQKYMQGSRSMKIDNWILLDNYMPGRGKSTSSQLRVLKAHSKRSNKHMSMKQHKKCGSFDLPQHQQKFDTFKPMHEIWKVYMTQLLKNTGRNQLAQFLLTVDLHGSMIIVAECKVTSFRGVSGIMIRETAETFGIITQEDKFQVVPKKLSVFVFQVDCWKITLHGDKLTERNLNL